MADENDEAPGTAATGTRSRASGEPAARAPVWRRREPARGERREEGQEARHGHGESPLRRKTERGAQAPRTSAYEGERVAKRIARSGLGSRRDAEAWIAQGRVTVNGRVLQSPAFNVVSDDAIAIDGRPLTAKERTRLWLFHKPRGCMTTESDPEGRPTLFDALPSDLPRVMTVGRLDFNTEGLILLTNDGGLARALELPSTGWLRRYRVRANGEIEQSVLDELSQGLVVHGVSYAGVEAALDRRQGANVWLTLGLREGKNREVKRILEHLGLAVSRLIRVSFGPFQLGDIEPGAALEIRTRVLREQLGENLAREAGADFDAPVREIVEQDRQMERGERRPKPATSPNTAAPAWREEPKPRKHVSALRAERAGDQAHGPRKRREHDATADRKGRPVAVERIRPATPKTDASTRNGRRFAEQRAGAPGERNLSRPASRRAGGKAALARSDERPGKSAWRDRPKAGDGRPPRARNSGPGEAERGRGGAPQLERRERDFRARTGSAERFAPEGRTPWRKRPESTPRRDEEPQPERSPSRPPRPFASKTGPARTGAGGRPPRDFRARGERGRGHNDRPPGKGSGRPPRKR